MRATRILLEIALLALSVFCLPQCGQGKVQACSDDRECSEEPNLFCDLAVHRCVARPCTPDCRGRECGPDPQNCGTSCGTCELANPDCNPATGRCESCSPDCGVRVCGPVPNGCGGSCGACKDTEVCNIAAGSCEACSPDCGERVCGPVPNGCGESCGNCADLELCDTSGGRCEPKQELIFDGSFKPTDGRVGRNGEVGAFEISCLARPDSFEVVEASTLPGNRRGYAGKFFQGAGSSYNCATNQHLFVGTFAGNIPKSGIRQVWYAFSIFFPKDWRPSGTFSKVGLFVSSVVNNGQIPNTGFAMGQKNDGSWEVLDNKHWAKLSESAFAPDVWHDYMYYINWQTDATGSFELWHKLGTETEYEKIYSRDNFQSEYDFGSGNYMMNRYGSYRGTSNVLQTLYLTGIKIGATRADVEYRD